MLCESSRPVCLYICHKTPTFDATSCSPPQIDSSETELSEEKAPERSYSQTDDDTFHASMAALHGSVCSADLDYLGSSTPKVPIGRTQCPLVAEAGGDVEKKKKISALSVSGLTVLC